MESGKTVIANETKWSVAIYAIARRLNPDRHASNEARDDEEKAPLIREGRGNGSHAVARYG